MTDLSIDYRDTAARHRGTAEASWWLQTRVGLGRHQAADVCPSEDERRRSEVQQRQRHRL